MMDTTNYESLEGKFGIANIDVQNRTNSGIYGYGKIYITKEHLVGIQQCMADNPRLKNRMSFLNFINSDGKIICFVDCLALFQKIPYDEVVRAIIDQCQEVVEVYEYKNEKQIKLLYKAMPLEA
mgnify:CR=1 FL=1|jgi:hypothetical protein